MSTMEAESSTRTAQEASIDFTHTEPLPEEASECEDLESVCSDADELEADELEADEPEADEPEADELEADELEASELEDGAVGGNTLDEDDDPFGDEPPSMEHLWLEQQDDDEMALDNTDEARSMEPQISVDEFMAQPDPFSALYEELERRMLALLPETAASSQHSPIGDIVKAYTPPKGFDALHMFHVSGKFPNRGEWNRAWQPSILEDPAYTIKRFLRIFTQVGKDKRQAVVDFISMKFWYLTAKGRRIKGDAMYRDSPFMPILQWFREMFLELAIRNGLKVIIVYGYHAGIGMREWWLRNSHLHRLVPVVERQIAVKRPRRPKQTWAEKRAYQNRWKKNAYQNNVNGWRDRERAFQLNRYQNNVNGFRDRLLVYARDRYQDNVDGACDTTRSYQFNRYHNNVNGFRDQQFAYASNRYHNNVNGAPDKHKAREHERYEEVLKNDEEWLAKRKEKRDEEVAKRLRTNTPRDALRFCAPYGIWTIRTANKWTRHTDSKMHTERVKKPQDYIPCKSCGARMPRAGMKAHEGTKTCKLIQNKAVQASNGHKIDDACDA
ncbi:hypothetical protein NA57DRAFT_55885 [Rhizodiscina lignyota]|uniref:Uncharacterized protein n=1 Tax=Rhizodiscina lignyota TaxID=1504668 RepID=A0A9P4IIK2_9PEZI|nr:hypothetical protein NA57DRAFT_55885 [Rhizodiscina lignyota]